VTSVSDLRTTYLGLELASPVVASASPLTGDVTTACRLAEAGAAAIVLPSLFEEEVVREEVELNRALEAGAEHFAEALDYFPDLPELSTAGDRYITNLERTKASVDVPVIASLNATSAGGWVRYAALLADAGADAIELNLYHVAADPTRSGPEIETADLETIAAVRAAVDIPVAVKLAPYYSSTANFAGRVAALGVDGLVLFNRFYQPDIDLDQLDVVPRVELSSAWELRLPLRWIAILRPHLGARTSLAASSGVASGTDVVKALAVGADVAMMTSALLRHGPDHLAIVLRELRTWLEQREYESVSQLRGSMSYATTDNPAAFERANYMKVLHSWIAPSELTRASPSS
jgi:dihydroorotate dehydrogenase (fumarate)